MPAPQLAAPAPADSQVCTPPAIFQPCLARSDLAAEMLNGYTGASAFDGVNGLAGSEGTGPVAMAA